MYLRLPEQAAKSWKASVATSASLPATGNTAGDARTTQDTGGIYIWNGTMWVAAGGGGGSSDSFYMWQGDTGSMTATSSTDVGTILGDSINIATSINSGTDTITIGLIPQTASRAIISSPGGALTVSLTTSTELGYVNGVTSAIQTQLNAKQATGNYITALTGEGTASGPGSVALTLTNSAVIGKVLTSLAAGTGAIAATDTILQGFGKAVASASSPVTANTLAIYSGTAGHLITPSTITGSGSTLNMSNSGQIQFGTSNVTLTNSSQTFQVFTAGAGSPAFMADAGTATIANSSASTVVLQLGGTSALASTIQVKGASSSGASATSSLRIFPGAVTGTGAGVPGTISIEGGGSTSSSSLAIPGSATLSGGITTNASSTAKGGDAIVVGGTTAGSGAGGNVVLQGGTSGSGAAGIVQIGRSSTTSKNALNNALGTNASGALTLTNGPAGTTGNPTGYLLITINGSDRFIPFW